jgi:hypothetical protein
MKPTLTLLAALLLAPLAALHAADAPKPETPAVGEVVYTPHPHFRWQREADVKIDEVHRIQIARDEAFTEVVCDDRLEVAVLSRRGMPRRVRRRMRPGSFTSSR